MSDRLKVTDAAWPWKPSSGAALEKTYHTHQIPLIGIIVQHETSTRHLFVRRYTTPELSVWMYATVTVGDIADLDTNAHSRGEFRQHLNHFESNRHVIYALAHSDRGVLSSFEHRGFLTSLKKLQNALDQAVAEDSTLHEDAKELKELFETTPRG
ncbi:hypothetical protein [Streptomyces sp. SGAir0957]